MNPNMTIYRRLNPRLLVQVGVGLGLLHWVNMSNISLTLTRKYLNQWVFCLPQFLLIVLLLESYFMDPNSASLCVVKWLGLCASLQSIFTLLVMAIPNYIKVFATGWVYERTVSQLKWEYLIHMNTWVILISTNVDGNIFPLLLLWNTYMIHAIVICWKVMGSFLQCLSLIKLSQVFRFTHWISPRLKQGWNDMKWQILEIKCYMLDPLVLF